MLQRQQPRRWWGVRRERCRCLSGHHAMARVHGHRSHRGEELSLRDGSRPAPQARPAGDGIMADDRRPRHALTHPRRRLAHQPPERQRQRYRRGAVDAAANHLARHDEKDRATRDAPVAACGDHEVRGRAVGSRWATDLSVAAAMPLQADRTPHRVTRDAAPGALRGTGLLDRRPALLPALDVDATPDNTACASILRHWNRSATRRLSAKIRSPRRLFVAGSMPRLRPPPSALRQHAL